MITLKRVTSALSYISLKTEQRSFLLFMGNLNVARRFRYILPSAASFTPASSQLKGEHGT